MSFQWLDAKYLSLLSFRLRNFKAKSQYNWNFSCPICGDSKTNKHKARGYVYPSKGKLIFHCHNCNVTMDIPRLLKNIDTTLHDEYVREKLLADPLPKTEVQIFAEKMKPPKFQCNTPLKNLKKVSSLSVDHPVKQYVMNRKIPPEFHYKMFLCRNFKHWVNEIVPQKFESEECDEPRLVIPLLDKEGNMFGFQGRSFKKNSTLRYITIILDDSKPKLFGLDTVVNSYPVYVVEGPIDSMFLPNCVASCGGDIIVDLPTIDNNKSRFVVVYDNEPRNAETVRKMEKAVDSGYKICVWPESMILKDINDMVRSGYTPQKVVEIINANVYVGIEAKLKIQMWKKL